MRNVDYILIAGAPGANMSKFEMNYCGFTDPSLMSPDMGVCDEGLWYYTPIDLAPLKKLDPWLPHVVNPFHVLVTFTQLKSNHGFLQKTPQIISSTSDIVYMVWTPENGRPPLSVNIHVRFLNEHADYSAKPVYSGVFHPNLQIALPCFTNGLGKFANTKVEIIWHVMASTDANYVPPLPGSVAHHYYGVGLPVMMPIEPFEMIDINLGRFFAVPNEMTHRPHQWQLTGEAIVQGLELIKEYSVAGEQHLWLINKSKFTLRINMERVFLYYMPYGYLTLFNNLIKQ